MLSGLTEALRSTMLDGEPPARFPPELGAVTLIGLALAAATHGPGEESDEDTRNELWRFFARGALLADDGGPALAEEARASDNR